MFPGHNPFDLLSPASEPGHQARFRQELEGLVPESPRTEPELNSVDVDLLMAQHLASAGTFIRFA